MRFLDGTRDGRDRDWLGDRLADVAGGLMDMAFDDWGFFFLVIGGFVLVVFVAVSLFGGLLSGDGFEGLWPK